MFGALGLLLVSAAPVVAVLPVRDLNTKLDPEVQRVLDAALVEELRAGGSEMEIRPLAVGGACNSPCQEAAAKKAGVALFVRTEITHEGTSCFVRVEVVDAVKDRVGRLGREHGRCDAKGLEKTLRRIFREPKPRSRDDVIAYGRDMLNRKPIEDSETLEDGAIFAVMRRHGTEIKACVLNARSKEPSVHGTATVKLTIVGDGRVKDVSVGPAPFTDSELGRCLLASVKDWRFPRFTGRSIPLDFPVHVAPPRE